MTELNFFKPIQTKEGHKVEILSTNVNRPYYPVVGVIKAEGKEDRVVGFTKDGICSSCYHVDNLVQAPSVVYVNVLDNNTTTVHKNLSAAKNSGALVEMNGHKVLARVKVPYVEGQFDE